MYLSPKIYKEYKIKEYEIRNQIDFEKIIISNFIEINNNTFLDFKNKHVSSMYLIFYTCTH